MMWGKKGNACFDQGLAIVWIAYDFSIFHFIQVEPEILSVNSIMSVPDEVVYNIMSGVTQQERVQSGQTFLSPEDFKVS